MTAPTTAERIRGCFLGGAMGDALGNPVEFMSLAQIRAIYSPAGITKLTPGDDGLAAITDDTQMTLWTAEGLIRAQQARLSSGSADWDPSRFVHFSYLRWLKTQGEVFLRGPSQPPTEAVTSGWLISNRELWNRRAPGLTCLESLRVGEVGVSAINDSKGCGGVMRVAPAGFVPWADPRQLGSDLALITHGHPSSTHASGALCLIIDRLNRGDSLPDAVTVAVDAISSLPQAGEVRLALDHALELAEANQPSAEEVEKLGAGWVAEEALAIGVYCALVATDFDHGVRLAVNHSGDSDSTGSIAGQILGTLYGESGVTVDPNLELAAAITELADDFTASIVDATILDTERYPTW